MKSDSFIMAIYYPQCSIGNFKNFFKKVLQDEVVPSVQPISVPEDIEDPVQAEVAYSEQPTSSNSGKKPFMTSYSQHQWLRQ